MAASLIYDLHNFVYYKPELVKVLINSAKLFNKSNFRTYVLTKNNQVEVIYIFIFCYSILKMMFYDLTDPLLKQLSSDACIFVVSKFLNNQDVTFRDIQFYLKGIHKNLIERDKMLDKSIIPSLLDENFASDVINVYKENPIDHFIYNMKNSISKNTKKSINAVKESSVIRNNIGWVFIILFILLLVILSD